MKFVRGADQDERRERPRGRGLLRVVGTATAACVVSAGLVALPVVGAPGDADVLHAAQDLPVAGVGSPEGEGVSIGVVGETTTTGPTTVAEVLAVLERAELAAKDAGREQTQEIEQAAAEVGMLLSTYLAQQADAGLRTPDDAARHAAPVVQDAAADPAGDWSVAGTAQVSRAVEPVASPADDVPEVTESGSVTFDDVVVAATRLANLLDPASESATSDVVLPAGGADGHSSRATLTAGLRSVVDKYAGSTAGYANGKIPTSVLCPLDFAQGHMLRCDAAEQLMALNERYEKEFGVPIPMTDSYRPYDVQVRLKATKGYLAATPGTSNHGWGLAVDLSTPISSGTSAEYRWLRVHGPDFGWDNPSWARLDGSKPEPWHFEFFASGPIPDRAWEAADVGRWDGDGDDAQVAKAKQGADESGQKADADKKSGSAGTKQTPGTKGSGKNGSEKKGSDGKGSKDDSKDKGSKPGSGGSKPGDGGTKPGETEKKVTVPDVTGQDLASAKKKLQALGLEVSTKKQASDEPEGKVVETKAAGTKVSKGSTVTLVVSSGPEQEQVDVPDVVGKGEGKARKALEGAGLVVEVVEEASEEQPEGVVLGADPGAGASVDPGSTVTIVVSSGPEQTEVPAVVGEDRASAEAALEDAGLVVEVVEKTSEEQPEGVVLGVDPGAGTAVDPGATVTIVVSAGDDEKDDKKDKKGKGLLGIAGKSEDAE